MKNILFIATLLFAQFSLGQEDQMIPTNNQDEFPKFDIFIGVGGVFYNDFAINSKIKASAMPEIRESMPELLVGLTTSSEKYWIDAELTFSYSNTDNNTTENQLASGSFRLRGHYNFAKLKRIDFSGGLNIAYSYNELNLFSKNNDINLDDLNPENNSGHVSLKNDIFYAGPSLAVNFRSKEKVSIRLNMGYEFAFTNGKWKSDFANVSNTVKENGQNRFMVGLVFF
jgi:uncharacterized protein YhjY with autotransporter beta-barrel domain